MFSYQTLLKIWIIFSHLLPQVKCDDPKREFQLLVSLEDNSYLLDSKPPLPNLQHLQDRLNQTNNLSGLLVYVRKLFDRIE